MKTFKFLWVLFFVALLIRGLVFHYYLSVDENYWQVDSNTYHVVAQQIAQGKGISNIDGSPHFYRVPGYPLFLALCYKIFGVSKIAALWVQVIMASCIPVLIFLLSLSLFPGNFLLAKLCSCLSVFHLGLVLYAGFFMTESIFIILLLLFLIFLFRAITLFTRAEQAKIFMIPSFRHFPTVLVFSDSLGPDYMRLHDALVQDEAVMVHSNDCWQQANQYLVIAGLWLGFASLVRPVGHYVLVIAIFVLFLSRCSWSERFVKSIILSFLWLVPVSFWLIRNYVLTGVLFFHTLPGGHFLYLSAARVAMHVHQVDYKEARGLLQHEVQHKLQQKEVVLGRPLKEIESCNVHERLALYYFAQRPLIALRYWVTDMLRASLSLYSAELVYLESGRQQINYFVKDRGIWQMFRHYLMPEINDWRLLMVIYGEMILFMLMLIGFVGFVFTSLVYKENFQTLLLTLSFIVLFITISLAGGYARMRLPIEPLILVLSCAWWIRKKY